MAGMFSLLVAKVCGHASSVFGLPHPHRPESPQPVPPARFDLEQVLASVGAVQLRPAGRSGLSQMVHPRSKFLQRVKKTVDFSAGRP